jgi:alcohol dehydrogenase (NADP+)
MIATRGYAAESAGAKLAPFRFERRDPGPTDIVIELLWCGVCHSDLYMAENQWGFSPFPLVPGHEMVGRVVRIGARVSRYRCGDIAAVGCMIGSCGNCAACHSGLEQYCDAGPVSSFGSYERNSRRLIFGGFSSNYVVDERFALKIPASLDPARAAPLLCAGITTYSPLRHWNIGPGKRVGVAGIGGLGHVAVKLARAMGAEVVAITSSARKRADAIALGAHDVILSSDPRRMKTHEARLDFVLDTVSNDHDVTPLLSLLRTNGTLCMVGIPKAPLHVPALALETRRRSIAGSIMGGIAETQEMLDFCATHEIGADVEVLPAHQVNEAFARLKCHDVRYRFVLDLSSCPE